VYEQEAAEWKEGWLVKVPEQYRTEVGGMCSEAAIAEIQSSAAVATIKGMLRRVNGSH